MHVNLIIALVSGITFVAYFIVAWRLRNSFTSVEDYFNYSRQMPENLFSDTFLATNVTFASIYLVITATTFERGNLTLWILIAWIVGLLLFRKLFPRATNFLEKGHTLHEFLGNTYQSDMLRKLASICTIIVFTGTLGIEFWGVMMILNGLGLTNSLTRGFVAIFIALVTSLYTMLGGFKAAVHTDHLQKYLILIMGFLLALLSFGAFGSLAGFSGAQRINILNDLFNLKNLFSDPLFSISIFIMFVPFNFCVMDMWQRCTATTKLVRNSAIKSVGSLKTMLTFAFAFGVPIIVGLAARQVSPKLSPASGMSILPNFISSLSVESALQIGVNALIYAGFFAALASTADTLLINISYTFVYDILAPCRNIDFSTIMR